MKTIFLTPGIGRSGQASMKMGFLLRHRLGLSTARPADLAGASVPAACGCLKEINRGEGAASTKEGQIVRHSLEDNGFAGPPVGQLAGGGL